MPSVIFSFYVQVIDCIFMQGIFFCIYEVRKYFDLSTDISLKDSEHLDPTKCESPVSFYPWFLLLKKKKNKTKLLNSAKSTCQRQFPSPTHSDIKMVTFSPTLQSPPSQVCEGFFFFDFSFIALPHASASMFSLENLSVCSLYFSIISLLPSVFYTSIFLSFLFHFLPTYPSPILSLSQF